MQNAPLELPGCALSRGVLEELHRIFEGAVSTADAERIAYATDCWTLCLLQKRAGRVVHPPDAVCWAVRADQVAALLALAQRERFAVVPYGGGSGVCGGTVPVRGGVALDLKRMRRLIEVREETLLGEAEAGILGQHLEDALNRRGYTLGHFPSSMACSTLGGWLAARSSGQASTLYGSIEDLVAGLELVLPDGRIALLPPLPRSAAGPDWKQVVIGSEGTLGVITRAWLRLRPLPAARRFLCYRFPGVAEGLAAIRCVLRRGYRPAVVRLYDPLDTLVGVAGGGGGKGLFAGLTRQLFDSAKRMLLAHPTWTQLAERFAGGCHAVFVCEGERALTDLEAEAIAFEATRAGAEDRGAGPARHWFEHRYDISYKGSPVFCEGGFVDTMELAAPWDRIRGLYAAVRAAISRRAVTLAHFSHAYADGVSVYFTFAAAAPDDDAAIALYRAIWDAGLKAAREAGGTVTHHHGVGLLKAGPMAEEVGPFLEGLRALRRALDPAGIMNPGKLGLDEE